jgi:sugar/nucleoside kinase (ribokinase family)
MAGAVVVCLGDVMTDIVVRPSAPVAVGSDTPSTVRTSGGGAAANTAAWLARTGHRAALVGCVGDDLLGRAALAELADAGVDLRVQVDRSLPTGTCVVLVGPGGERTMFPDPGANAALLGDALPADLLVPGNHLHLSGYALLKDGSRPAARAALALARQRGLTVSADPASVGPLRSVGVARMLEWLDGVDLLMPNADEALLLAGLPPDVAPDTVSRAGQWLADRFGQVVVTRAGGGASWFGPSGTEAHVRVQPVAAVDATGAGDCFAAGFLPPWLAGAEPSVALAAGCALAARAVAQVGARPDG